nr:MAG TPA: hypothetical protein [Crassvirales sp.]
MIIVIYLVVLIVLLFILHLLILTYKILILNKQNFGIKKVLMLFN